VATFDPAQDKAGGVTTMKILLAIDGSSHSQDAVDEVAKRPWPLNSIIRVLSVFEPYTPPATEFVLAGATLDDITRQQITEANRLTTGAAGAIKAANLSTEVVVREGDPRSAIVDEADEWGADLIVVGSHGRTGIKRLLLGSVAEAVVGHAHCSIEVVRRRQPVAARSAPTKPS
jgi:nucleotide-binding universal stress UspA family protein